MRCGKSCIAYIQSNISLIHCNPSGGGISGLTLILVLKKFMKYENITVDLYEAEPAFTEIGAGISVWERTRYIFNVLGIAENLNKRAVSPPMTFRKSDTKSPVPFNELQISRTSACLTSRARS